MVGARQLTAERGRGPLGSTGASLFNRVQHHHSPASRGQSRGGCLANATSAPYCPPGGMETAGVTPHSHWYLHPHIHSHIQRYTSTHPYALMHTHPHTHSHTHTQTQASMHMHSCTHIHTHTARHTHTHRHPCTHVHGRIHTHTLKDA